MKQVLSNLVPEYVSRLCAYVPGKPIEEVERELGASAIKLASNENAFGPSPRALEAMKKQLASSHRYPDAGGFYLREKLAERHGMEAEQVVLGCGSTELIQLLCRIYCAPGAVGLSAEGSFVMFPLSVQAAGGETVLVPLKEYAYDLDALAAAFDARTRAVYLANPNNPTGTFLPVDEVARLHAGLPRDVFFVLDQAYGEYLQADEDDGGLALAARHDNVLVTRTFSKIYGLAGERIGWATGAPALIATLNRIRGPFNVTVSGQVAARAALADQDFVERSRRHNAEGLARFAEAVETLGNRGLHAVPSKANFLLVLFEGALSAERALAALAEAGYAVRHLPGQRLPHALRITIGSTEDMDEIAAVLRREAEAAV